MEGGQESQLYQVSEAVIQVSISLFFVHWINEDQSQLMIWLRVCNLLMSNARREIPSTFHALMRIIHKMMNFSAFIFLLTRFFCTAKCLYCCAVKCLYCYAAKYLYCCATTAACLILLCQSDLPCTRASLQPTSMFSSASDDLSLKLVI